MTPVAKKKQTRKQLEAKIKAKSVAIATKKSEEQKTEEEIELEEMIQEDEKKTKAKTPAKKPAPPPAKKKRTPPPGFTKKKELEQKAGTESIAIDSLPNETKIQIENEEYWRNHWQEIDELIQEDVEALDLTLEERVRLAKKRKNKNGRPSRLTEVVIRKLKEAFENDCTITEACRRAKIGTTTYYDWKKKDKDFQYEMDFYEDYLANISRTTVSKWGRVNPQIAMQVLQKRDERYKPNVADLPQIQLIQINTGVINVQQLEQTERSNIEVYEPEEVRKRRLQKFSPQLAEHSNT